MGTDELLLLLRQGQTLRQIGAALGVSHETIRNRLKARGLTTSEARARRCRYCGTVLRDARRRVCPAADCQRRSGRDALRRYREARTAPGPPKVCASCGRILPGRALENGNPSFCKTKACQAAHMRWYLATHEAARARQRELARRRRWPTGVCADCGRERRLESRGRCGTCYEHWRYARRPELREAQNARTRERMRRVRAAQRAAEARA